MGVDATAVTAVSDERRPATASVARVIDPEPTDQAPTDVAPADPQTDAAEPVPDPAGAISAADAAPGEPSGHEAVDLDAIERDLDDVETALARLAEGTYRVDELTGEPLPDELLERNPTARRA